MLIAREKRKSNVAEYVAGGGYVEGDADGY